MNEEELLFTDMLKCDRASLYLDKNARLGKERGRFAAGVLKRRASGEPLQYILGKADFMGLELKVSPDVLIPRPETEILVEAAVGYISKIQKENPGRLSVLEIGTGSGCIAICLAKSLKDISITATDISAKALSMAKKNAVWNKVSRKINFMQSDLFHMCNKTYNVIVSNPPYVPTGQIDNLQPEIKFEPRIALDGGTDGLKFHHRIINESLHYLARRGLLILEIGFGQLAAVMDIFSAAKEFEVIHVVTDYNKIDRVVIAKRK
jgi:release factor glutamine methyltransferase